LSIPIAHPNNSTTKLGLADIVAFSKLRLTALVVMSAAFCFVMASNGVDWKKLIILIIGGFLVTAASNGFNQIIEKDLDKLMNRTCNRPLPSGRMNLTQAYLIASIMGILGIILLWVFMNPLSGILGALALILYSVVYTPMKQKSPVAVFIGAFPGAIPPMLGWVAATGELTLPAIIVFSVQFLWQFPHFWAIAWVLDDDYKKAGFYMLPSKGGRNQSSAFQILSYTLCLIPVSLIPFIFNMCGPISFWITLVCGLLFAAQAVKLYQSCDIKDARRLMFGSFLYLPIVQIAMMLDKI
jgi:protoheme IX farnesyltransferase